MNNQHNPVARKIEQLQVRWMNACEKKPGYKLIRWLIKPEDTALINGFYKLESSPYGKIPDFFLVMLTPFELLENYSRQLIFDIMKTWEQDETVSSSEFNWDLTPFSQKLHSDISPDTVLCEMLIDFHSKFCREEQFLVLSLLPRLVQDMNSYNDWIIQIAEKLPETIKISLTDDLNKNYHKDAFKPFKDKTISIQCKDLNLGGIARQMATEGHEKNPEANFRRCVFEMSDAAAVKDQQRIDKWGTTAIQIAQKTGNKNLMATAYLIYAGFYMFLRKDEINELLDKGILIAENEYKTGDKEIVGVLLQLYGYKSSYFRSKGQKTKATQWIFKQVQLAIDNRMGAYTISICSLAARMAKTAREQDTYSECLRLGYHAGDELLEEELRTSEITMLAYHYANELRREGKEDEFAAIQTRMKSIFGDHWDENILSFSENEGQTIPDINELIPSLN